MKAAVLTALNAPLTIADVEPVLPLGFGQVLVKVLVSGICGAQLQEIRGEKGGPLPHLMGHEGCGMVESIGPGVSRVKPGDKVVMHWRKAAGIESDFPRYEFVAPADPFAPRTFTSGLVTTWSEFSVCSENRLTPVPPDTDPNLAALLGCGLSTALATIENEIRRMGQRILVIGAGGLGSCLLHAMPYARAAHVCACDVHAGKRPDVESTGAEFFLADELRAPRKPRFDVILDTAGHPGTMELALDQLAPSGRYVMIGQPPPGAPVCIRAARHMFDGEGKTITATQGGGFMPGDMDRFLAVARHLPVQRIVTHVFRLEEINSAIDLVRAGSAGRVVIQFP